MVPVTAMPYAAASLEDLPNAITRITHATISSQLISDAPVERRLDAALALDPKNDPDAAVKIRVAADACADERVRVALEGIAAGETEARAIEEAVAARE